MKKLKIVVLEAPYDTYTSSDIVRNIMRDVFKLKLLGYRAYHDYGVMPISGDDFFANHVIVGEHNPTTNEFNPIAGFKSITNLVCKKFSIEFPIVRHVLQGCEEDYPVHISEIQNWIKNQEKQNHIFAYNFGWTILPNINKFIKEEAKKISMAIYYYYYSSYGIENIITAAFKPFHVDKIQETMGFDYLANNQNRLPAYKSKQFFGKELYIMHLNNNEFPKDFINFSRNYKDLWENRITYNTENISEDKIAA